MAGVIGVVGPHDLVDKVALTCQGADLTAYCFDYDDIAQAPGIVEARSGTVDGWLFTGIAPYTLAERAGVIDRPAVYVRYTSEALQQLFIRCLRQGREIDRMSIDTMSHNAVRRTFERAHVSPDRVRVLPYRSDLSPEDYAEFHLRARAGRDGTTFAVTCLTSVYERLPTDGSSWRLEPSRHSIRTALRQLVLDLEERRSADANVAIGLVEIPGGERILRREVAAWGAALGELPRSPAGAAVESRYLVATTRGRLAAATENFTTLPALERLAAQLPEAGTARPIRIGFGLGATAAEAEHLARTALGRARRLGPLAAVLARRHQADVVLATASAPTTPPPTSPEELARASGIAAETLTRLHELGQDDAPLTVDAVAAHLGLRARSARRILHRLTQAGLAERVGQRASAPTGRPSTLYRLTLSSAGSAVGSAAGSAQ